MELESFDVETNTARIIVEPAELVNAGIGIMISPHPHIRKMADSLPLFAAMESSNAKFDAHEARLVLAGNIALAGAVGSHPEVEADLAAVNKTISSGLAVLSEITRASSVRWDSL
jgi:hypothetical protein